MVSTARSLKLQGILLACIVALCISYYFTAYWSASSHLAETYDGRCHWLGEYSRDCSVSEYLSHEARSAFFPAAHFPQALLYLAYFALSVWLLRFAFELLGFFVSSRQQPGAQ